ncbi:uncharacterized protein [Nicotiana sylvestris]|uniref:uncharacterized protein n=1 Tax=Nicotiana sylvestris TaxID=4096 RepID=UPI00388CCF79
MAASSLRNPRPPRGYFPPSTPQHYYPHQDVAYAMAPQPYANSRAEGHDTEDCWILKRAIENLIEQKRVVLKDEEIFNVTNNPLPAHNNGPIIGMICEDKEFDPALKAIIAIADVEKKSKVAAKQDKGENKSNSAVRSEENMMETKTGTTPPKDAILYVPQAHRKEQLTLSPPKRFELIKRPKMYVPKWTYVVRGPVIPPRLNEPLIISRAPQRPMKDPTSVPWNYNREIITYKGKEIIGEVNETNPSGKYLNLEEVNNAKQKRFPLKKPKVLIKTLNKAYVPIETTVEQLERMAERFLTVNLISFSKNVFPLEGAAHNKALYLTVKCEGYYVKRVMVDGGSGVDICPLSTLQRMEIGTKRIRPNNICLHAFDGIKRDTIGEIDLILTIGPVDFEVTF